ncbi:MAG TPA: hypothetical protein VIL23_04845 [Clostridia bacterium]
MRPKLRLHHEASGWSSHELIKILNEKSKNNILINDYERLTPKQKTNHIKRIVQKMCYHYYSNGGVIDPDMLEEWIEILSRMVGFENHAVKMSYLQKRLKTRKKIVFLGSTNCVSKQDIKNICKNYGFVEEQIEIRDDYSKMTNQSLDSLKNKNKYLGLLVGAIPHSIKGISNMEFIKHLEENACDYPPFKVCKDKNNELGFSVSAIKQALSEIIRLSVDT